MPTSKVVVVGSVNHDLTVEVARLPRPGETVLGTSHQEALGGKGANQAIAAARLGARTDLVARVGDDERGSGARRLLGSEGVGTSFLTTDQDLPTGVAVITVDPSAENSIVVSPGANAGLGPEHVEAAASALDEAAVVLAQLEVPLSAVEAAGRLAGGIFCLNPAPAAELGSDLRGLVDVLVPNRTELALLAGVDEPETIGEAERAALSLGVAAPVVTTLGASGALITEAGGSQLVQAPEVEPVDTTGAGDAFCGALGAALGRGLGLGAAVQQAVAAGAMATMAVGAQAAMPTRDGLGDFMSETV